MQFVLFLPQMRMDLDTLTERALAAERAGFDGIALMDHLAPPMAEQHDMIDAMVAATWLLSRTTTLKVGHLVLCDAFRHPAVLARQAVSLDRGSGGRFELGIGWGSVPTEFDTFGVGDTAPAVRVERLRETLDVLGALWRGEQVTYDGVHHKLVDAVQQPTPSESGIPIVIGGAGPKTMALVSEFATWWNCPTHRLDRFDALIDRARPARASMQQMIGFIPAGVDRAEHEALIERRFGYMASKVVGDATELVDYFGELGERGVERFYPWFTDFASPDTLAEFGETVIGPCSGS